MATHPLDSYLGAGDSLARLQAHAARLVRLQRELEQLLPPYLAAASQVANLKGEELVIHTESSAIAVKLRQAAPSLQAEFARRGVLLSGIKVKVALRRRERRERPAPERHVSERTRSGLDDLAGRLPPDSPLAQALKRFVRRAG